MVPDLDGDVARLSDKELLDAIEKLLRAPGFIDLCLGYDPASSAFYAGEEAAGSLRDVLRRVLTHNRPRGLALRDLLGRSCAVKRATAVCSDNSESSLGTDGYSTVFP